MRFRRNPQLNAHGELVHLLSIEGLPREVIHHILDTAGTFLSVNDREVKKVPLLRGKSVFNLFFENSTRTRTTFEIAAKRLSADVINLDIARSSTAKGESLLDTIANLSAMHADMFVVRHSESGAPYLIAQHCAPHVHVVNAGDGRHAHPTQGLLDMYTIRHYKKDFTGLTCGHRRRHRALARGALRHPCADHAGRARSACSRPQDAGARRPGRDGRARVPRHGRGHPRRRCHHHAAPAERTHGRRPAAQRRVSSSRASASRPRSSRWPSPTAS